MLLLYLQSESSGRFYVGSSEDLQDRLARHEGGRTHATKGRGPWKLVYVEEHATRAEAVRRELEVKRWKSARRIALLVEGNASYEGERPDMSGRSRVRAP